ncbi:MAG: Ig-like domain-containing protein [Coriobacteriia bacterium]|nr:Ig-like domain-containing protein [Coriobacteriia bacterium]
MLISSIRQAVGMGPRIGRLCIAVLLAISLMPMPAAHAARQDLTIAVWADSDRDGKPELFGVDWDGDGLIDEWWHDDNEDGVVDRVEVENTGGNTFRSPRGRPGMRVRVTPLAGGGAQVAVDWNGDGRYDEVWWDVNGDGRYEDTDTYETESKVVDNTKATRFRGVFVGVNNRPLQYPEKDVDDICDALDDHTPSWNSADMAKLKGAGATPAAIQSAINAAKASSKPGDEFVFYFSGHGGGWNKKKGKMGGGFVDGNGDESANRVPESEFGRFDGSRMPTPPAGYERVRSVDMDGDGATDTQVVKDDTGKVTVRRRNATPTPEWREAGSDSDGDGDVDGDDGGVDMNGDGDKNDFVGVDDTIQVAGGVEISDDTIAQWLSGFPESVTIVVILDCCHAGSFVNDMQRLTDSAGKPLRPGHMEVVAAAAWDETAAEEPISNGVLTQAILDALTPLPPSTTGGHTTSLADYLGNRDDRTTTAELAKWVGPSAVTYLNTDNDGDGRRNEDDIDTIEVFTGSESIVASGDPAVFPPLIRTVEQTATDIDGDTKKGEDKSSRVVSFFDVCCDPEFGSRGTPRLLNWVSGDAPFDLSGMGPAIRLFSASPVMPGTTETPGPTLEFAVRQLPAPARPAPMTAGGPMQYGSEVFDVNVNIVNQMPELDTVTTASVPVANRLPMPVLASPSLRMELQPLPGVPLEVCLPAVYDTPTAQWQPIMERVIDPDRQVISFSPEHFSRYALLYLGPPPIVPDPAPLPPKRLLASADGETVTVAWSNPTDPDFLATRLLRSTLRFAEGPSDATSVQAYEGDFVARVETLAPGTYYYTAFSRDLTGGWSLPVTATAAVLSTPTNLPPLAVEDTYTAEQDATLTVPAPGLLANDSDPDGDPLAAELVSPPLHGTAVVNASGAFTYHPNLMWVGSDTFSYRASDGTTYSAPCTVTVSTQPFAKRATETTITSAGRTITYGQLTMLAGRITVDATGLAGAAITIERSSNGLTFAPFGTVVVSGSDGTFDFTVHPSTKTWYRAVYAGSAEHEGSTSGPVLVQVRAKVGTPTGTTSLRAGVRATFRGTLSPAHANGARVVKVYRERYLGRGRWQRAGGYILARVSTVRGRSTYSATSSFTKGTWRLRAYHADAAHAAAWSQYGKNIRVR